MNDRGLFSPVVLGFLIASVVAIFALSVVLTTIGKGDDTPFKATSSSPSAIGHQGFYTLLQQLDFPVERSRLKGRAETGEGGLLIVEEPERHLMRFGGESELGVAPNVLLVLPKWSGRPDFFKDGWVRKVDLLHEDVPGNVLAVADKKAKIARDKPPSTWTTNALRVTPVFTDTVQLMTSHVLKPLIADGEKILLGELDTDGQRVWILSDPDPLENHGIMTPANTRFALALVAALREDGGRIVFDETVHGAVAPERNPLQLLFKFPFVIVTVEMLAALALLLLATTTRFGAPEELPPPFAHGKARLIDNIAALMDRAGHQAFVLRRYVGVKLADAGRALHAPAGLDEGALAKWLDRISRSRGFTGEASAIITRSTAITGRRSQRVAGLLAEAQNIDRWSRDILDGSSRRQDHR